MSIQTKHYIRTVFVNTKSLTLCPACRHAAQRVPQNRHKCFLNNTEVVSDLMEDGH